MSDDTIRIIVNGEDSVRIGGLLAGQAHVIRQVQAYDEERVRQRGFQIFAPSTRGVNNSIAFRPDNPLVADIRVRRALLRVDNNILKLDSAFDATVRRMNNPQSASYTVRGIVEAMKRFDGRMILQTMFLRGECGGQPVDNTTEEEVSAWLRLVAEIRPQQVMVYSLDRDTPCPTLEKVTKEELQAIAARVEALGIPCSVA